MVISEQRPNWLSEIIESKRIVSDRPIPWQDRTAERDAVVEAIKAHPEGQQLAALPDLADIVWGAMGAAHHRQREIEQNPDEFLAAPAIHASFVIFGAIRWSEE